MYYRHGFAQHHSQAHPMYTAWRNMKSRCDNPKRSSYANYGGRGIGYSPDWKSWDVFYEDMVSSWKPGLSLDRIDSNKDYSKENCRWADWFTQANNKKNNVWLEFKGERKTVAQWSRERGIKHTTLKWRVANGWPIERALQVTS